MPTEHAPEGTHTPPQFWKPALQVQPHTPAPEQLGVAFAGAVHAVSVNE